MFQRLLGNQGNNLESPECADLVDNLRAVVPHVRLSSAG